MSSNVNKKKTYVLVEFLSGKKKECAVVPLIWLLEERKKCYWPKIKSQQIFNKLVFDNAPYDSTWMKYKVHRVLKVSDDYDGIMKYMDVILEHGSTEDDGLNSVDISQKKIESSANQEEEDISDLSDSSKRMLTKTKYESQKNTQKNSDHEESEFSNSNSSENEIDKQKNFDDSKEYDSSSSEKNVNEESFKDNSTSSILCTNKNISKGNKCQNQSNVSRYNDGITSRSENSSKNTQNKIDTEYDRDTTVFANMNRCSSSRLEPGARTMSEEQFQKYMVERMENLTILCEQNNACISRLLQTMQTFLNPTSKPDGLPDLPLKNNNDFDKLEEQLSTKTVDVKGVEVPSPAYTYLKGRLSTIGGADQRSSVMNMLKFVITNDLAMTYNWKGQKKKSFENTKLREVITDAAKIQFKGSNSSDQCIKDAIQSWLKLAKSRYVYNTNPKGQTKKKD